MPQVYAFNGNRPVICEISRGKVLISRSGVALFNRQWPGSKLRDRAYWFEFDRNGNLVDCDVPEQDDGFEAAALAQDASHWLFHDEMPQWAAKL